MLSEICHLPADAKERRAHRSSPCGLDSVSQITVAGADGSKIERSVR